MRRIYMAPTFKEVERIHAITLTPQLVSFVHLHVHSEFSLSSSLCRMDEIARQAAEWGMPAVAVTDWGNMYGALYLQKEAKYANIKPIFGLELGVTVPGTGPFLRHLVLLAENFEGFKNLCELSTQAHTVFGLHDGEMRPQIPIDEVLKRSKGLIALTGGLKGILNSFLVQDQEQLARETFDRLLKAFGRNHLFLELQETGISLQNRCNEKLVEWSRESDVGLVATTDAHYMKREDAIAHEIWMMVERKMSQDQNPRSSLVSQEYCFKSPQEMSESFAHLPQALENTLKIAERCNVKLSFKDAQGQRIYHLPQSKNQEEIFRAACEKGLQQRFDETKITKPEQIAEYKARLDYEINIIAKMGFAGYYLIVADFVQWAKKNDIPVGPGRGSGAGSLCAYSLDITDLDPLEYGLLFERFLNPERVSLPDFDIDFCQERRGEVIRYVSEKYGKDRVCQIVTFAREQSKNAIKDVGRVLGMSFSESNRLTKLIPSVQMKPLSIKESLEQVREMQQLVEADPKVRQVIDIGMTIEGSLRQAGVHAAGVIIAGSPLHELAPLSLDVNGNLISQWDMKMSEEAGLVKFDFLGLVTLDLMQLACRWLNKRSEPECQKMTYANIPMHDPRIYEMISKGDTLGVFQLESGGMQNLCVRMKPDRFTDICAINALFRPGPLEAGMVDDYISRKQGRSQVEYPFPLLEACLKETYGVIVYQEQIQEIAKVIASYTLGGADLLRRAMGKKNKAEMEAQRATFTDGAKKSGYDPKKAGDLFDDIEKFAGYGFNKSHAAAYAKLAVQTAYLKAVYPTEFFTALLTIEKTDTDKLSRYIQDARVRGLQILPPDINESESDFAIAKEGVIRFGLSAIKNVGENAVEEILNARQAGPFRDLHDFLQRVNLRKINKRNMECLVQAGAFDSIGGATGSVLAALAVRGKYLANLEKFIEWAQKAAEEKEAGQFSLFGGSGGAESIQRPPLEAAALTLTERDILGWEKTLLGVYVTASPLDKYLERAKGLGAINIFDLAEKAPKSTVIIAAVVSEIREVRVKRGRMAGENMGIIKLEDASGQVEMISFPEHYKEFQALYKSQQPLLIRGELDFEEDKPKLMGSMISYSGEISIQDLSEVKERWPQKIRIGIDLDSLGASRSVESLYKDIAELLRKHHGPVPVGLVVHKSGSFATTMELGRDYGVQPQNSLMRELEQLVTIPGALRVDAVH